MEERREEKEGRREGKEKERKEGRKEERGGGKINDQRRSLRTLKKKIAERENKNITDWKKKLNDF